ncbi:TVP38/TMEM64 family protein [Salmonirosea aquatica]|uniref:TVP38/TMEM64 family membrane protein n=1 Tax=Salmonirosea aquatica TaxID=2654236 RepID=A0A7C9BGP8_9BACT|nr:TVP38/TMEM64 family protein [Cytophagaceae bacterium SJW1-29]
MAASPHNSSGIAFTRYLPLVLSALIIGGGTLFYFLLPDFQQFCREAWQVLTSGEEARVASWVSQFGLGGPALLLVLFFVQMIAFVIPSWLLILVCTLAYGPWWGSALALLGILLASTAAYFIGKSLSKATLLALLGKKAEQKMATYLKNYGLGTVILFRLAPFLSNDTISFMAGLTRMHFWRFMAGTALGITPLIGFLAYLGGNTERLQRGLIWASVVCTVGFGMYVWWDRTKRPKTK